VDLASGLFFDEALLESGWARDVRIGINAGAITSIKTRARPEPQDERHAIGLPGMPNVHSHAFQRGMAGLAEIRGPDHDTFWTWRELMYRFALAMSPDDLYAVAALAYMEMLEAGFTRVGEFHYLHHNRDGKPFSDPAEMAGRIIAAAQETGIGLTLLPVFYAHGGFGGKPATPNQRRFVCDADSFARLVEVTRGKAAALSGCIVGVAPHSLRAVTPDELKAIRPLAGDGPIHIHAAEQIREVEECVVWSGRRPVEWLLDHAAPDSRWCLIHATHMTEVETRRLAQAGVVAGLCPITEANLGDGIFDGREFLASGGRFGIGSDSNVLIGVADELRQLEYTQRLHHRERNVMSGLEGASTGRTLYETAAQGGALVLGASRAIIAPGAQADIVSLHPSNPALIDRHGDQILDAWIFAAQKNPVDCVWVGGQKLVEAARHCAHGFFMERYGKSISHLLTGYDS
jgi:formiminoglutamate deiminase